MYNIYIYTSIFVTYIQYCNTYYDAMRAFNINSTNINNLSMFSLLLILSELNSETKGSQKDDDNTTSLFILKVILGRINTSKEETITKERLEKRDSRDSKTSINDNNTDNNNIPNFFPCYTSGDGIPTVLLFAVPYKGRTQTTFLVVIVIVIVVGSITTDVDGLLDDTHHLIDELCFYSTIVFGCGIFR